MAFDSGYLKSGTAILLASNVIPSRRKVAAESWTNALQAIDLYDPRDVPLNRVTGGFNTAVQISASYSLRSYAWQIGHVSVIARKRGDRMASDLAGLQADIVDAWWGAQALDSTRGYGFGFDLTPTQLVFSGSRSATITFRGTISFMTEAIIVDPAPPTGPQEPSKQPAFLPPRPAPASGGLLHVTGLGAETIDRTVAAPELEIPMRVVRPIGNIEVTLTAPYDSTEHGPQRSVDVWLNLDEAVIAVRPDAGDAKLFYDTFLAAKGSHLAAQIAPVAQLPLTPTISLAGRNPANSRIEEFSEFETRVFHVTERRRQALCVAFDVVPSCRGIIDDVQHFIGGNDYGVIHDEYVVERVLHHKWNEGGFDRSMRLTKNVSLNVRRNGRDGTEDATIFGRLVLTTLDVVALAPHADLRTDVLSLGGQAQAIADRVVLADGTVLTPDKADLGPAEDTSWSVDISAATLVPWNPDPELRDFQGQAHRDGVRHLARPFSRFPTGFGFPEVQYTRTEAVQKRLFFLGQLPIAFI